MERTEKFLPVNPADSVSQGIDEAARKAREAGREIIDHTFDYPLMTVGESPYSLKTESTSLPETKTGIKSWFSSFFKSGEKNDEAVPLVETVEEAVRLTSGSNGFPVVAFEEKPVPYDGKTSAKDIDAIMEEEPDSKIIVTDDPSLPVTEIIRRSKNGI